MKERKQEFVRMNQTQINETKSKKWCKRLPLLAAFLIPLLISVIICIDHEVYPFGERCLLQVDMYHQYCPFFTEFVDKLRSGESLMYDRAWCGFCVTVCLLSGKPFELVSFTLPEGIRD